MKSPTPLASIPVQFTSGNFLIVILGTVLLAYGLHRMFPLQINRSFLLQNGTLAVMLAIGIILLCREREPDSFLKWGQGTARLAGRFLPLMILLCLVMAIGNVITQLHEASIQSFLLKHRFLGPWSGVLLTPTSNSMVPTVESSWKEPDLRPMCLFFLQASAMMSVPLFMLRQLGFSPGSPLPSRMYAMGAIVSVFLFVFMKPLFWMTEALCTCSGTIWNLI